MDDTISLIDLGEIILDGGNVVKTPYHVIMTEKIFEENRHIDSDRLIARIEEAFQTEVLLVPWLGPKYDTFGHTDGLVRYIKDKDLLMDNYTVFDKAKAKQLYKALEGKGYTVHELELPYGYDYSWAYINFLQTYKVIVMPKFGLKPMSTQISISVHYLICQLYKYQHHTSSKNMAVRSTA